MLTANLASIDQAELQRLCDTRCTEGSTLDFKGTPPGTSDREKHEFLKDVCALANADGGDLVYGIEEFEGVADKLQPILGESFDSIQRRLGQSIESGIEPRALGIRMHQVQCDPGFCLVIRVPASFDGPHRFVHNGHSKFVTRNGTHTSELTYAQLRSSFDRSATLSKRAVDFVAERTALIGSGDSSRAIEAGPVCVLHLVPIASMARQVSIDVASLHKDYNQLTPPGWSSVTRALNLDGLIIYPYAQPGEGVAGFVQAFRSGALEAARFAGGRHQLRQGKQAINSAVVSIFFRDLTSLFLSAARSFGIAGPAVLQASLLRVGGYEFAVGEDLWPFERAIADRPNLRLPDFWVESIEAETDADSFARPMLDVLWQAFGLERCPHFTEQGVWQRRG